MNLSDEIQKEHSKINSIRVAKIIGNDPALFSELMKLFFDSNRMDTARRSAWIMRECVQQHSYLLEPYIYEIIQYLQTPDLHDAIKRNALALLKEWRIPEKDRGMLINTCFKLIESGTEPTAIKAFAIEIIYKTGKNHPEINHELKLILEDQIPFGSAGFQNKARKIIESIR